MSQVHFLSKPSGPLRGEIRIPGDKSISHRSIIFGALADGVTQINGFLEGEDCLATLRAFQLMGVRIDRPAPQTLEIHGVGLDGLKQPESVIDCGNSGTTMRLLAGLLAAQAFDSELTGDASLLKRPMERVSLPLGLMGAKIKTNAGRAPLTITGGQQLRGIEYQLPVASAQIKSCLLLAGLYAQGVTVINEPGPSRDHTEKMLKSFGYPLIKQGSQLQINSKGSLKATTLTIPGDISSAAFLIVAATIIPGSEITIRNVGVNPTRTGILTILLAMGAQIQLTNPRFSGEEPIADLQIQYAPLKGIVIDPALVPLAIDEFPALFIAAACAEGDTLLRGAAELRTKESDRIGAMATGLNQLGIQVETYEDGLLIHGGRVHGGEVDSCHDHRIAMAFSIAGAIASSPVKIKDCINVTTSFPDFVNLANHINLNINTEY